MDCVWDTGRTAGEGERFGGDTYRWKNMSESRIMGYARVSSAEQSLARQLVELKKYVPEENIVTDKQSGKDLNRPGYQALKGALGLRRGDVLVIKSLDRLSRNKQEMKQELQWFKDISIRLKVIDLPTTMMDLPNGHEWVFEMVNNILIEVLGTIAEQERLTIRQRQREGINAAKAKGKHLGRPAARKPDNWDEVIALWQAGEITAREAMRQTGLRKSCFYRFSTRC